MKSFLALVHKDEGSAFGVTFPDLPGCFSAADEFNDLVPNAVEALELWFEDVDPNSVVPREFEAIRTEFAADLAEGAFLIQVPYVRRTTKQVRVNISVDQGTLDAIDQAASAMKLTRSAFIAMASLNQIKGQSAEWVQSAIKAVEHLGSISQLNTTCSPYFAIFPAFHDISARYPAKIMASTCYGGEGVEWDLSPSAEPEVQKVHITRK